MSLSAHFGWASTSCTSSQYSDHHRRQTPHRPPKSLASRRVVALDSDSLRILHRHARRQRAEAGTAGQAWTDTGYVFTRLDGAPINPKYLTYRFRTLVRQSGLPPIRLHDLRHGAASLALEVSTSTSL